MHLYTLLIDYTPLVHIIHVYTGMGIDFDITEAAGPVMSKWTTMADVNKIKLIDPHKSTKFVADALKNLRQAVGNNVALINYLIVLVCFVIRILSCINCHKYILTCTYTIYCHIYCHTILLYTVLYCYICYR